MVDIYGRLAPHIVRAKDRLRRSLSTFTGIANSQAYFGDVFQHERMVGDTVRVDTYHAAVSRLLNPSDVVVDVGTGTGVLALLAASQRPKKIYAIDHSAAMLEYAAAAAAANGVYSIEFIEANSRSFRPPERVDVILHEQMASMLLEERMHDTLLDLRDRVLKPGGRILPSRFDFYLEPVQLHDEARIPFLHERPVHGISFPEPPTQGASYYYRRLDASAVDHPLCDPEPVWTFDLMTLQHRDVPSTFTVSKPVRRAGRLDGICTYFVAWFDHELSLSTAPWQPRTHWTNPLYRVPARDYQAGDTFEMSIRAPEIWNHLGWQWHVG